MTRETGKIRNKAGKPQKDDRGEQVQSGEGVCEVGKIKQVDSNKVGDACRLWGTEMTRVINEYRKKNKEGGEVGKQRSC